MESVRTNLFFTDAVLHVKTRCQCHRVSPRKWRTSRSCEDEVILLPQNENLACATKQIFRTNWSQFITETKLASWSAGPLVSNILVSLSQFRWWDTDPDEVVPSIYCSKSRWRSVATTLNTVSEGLEFWLSGYSDSDNVEVVALSCGFCEPPSGLLGPSWSLILPLFLLTCFVQCVVSRYKKIQYLVGSSEFHEDMNQIDREHQ